MAEINSTFRRPVNPSDVYRVIDMPGRAPVDLPFVPGLEVRPLTTDVKCLLDPDLPGI